MRPLALAVMIACSLPALSVRAADAIVLSIGGDAPAEVSEEARAAAATAIEADGVTIVPQGEIALRIAPSRLRGLASLADARSIAFELEARMVVGVAVWMRAGAEPPAPESIAVSLLVGSRTFSATREIGEAGLVAAATAAMQDVRGQQTRAMVIEGGSISGSPVSGSPESVSGSPVSGSAAAAPEPGIPADPADPSAPGAVADNTPAFDIIGPTMLLAFGAAGVGLGVYAVLDGTCEVRGETVCLRGEEPNPAVGITLTVAGALALAGGIVWLATGAAVIADQPRIDVVMGPEGGAVAVRGTF